MRSPAKPFALLLVVAAATFGLAQWHPFAPSAPAADDRRRGRDPRGDGLRGELRGLSRRGRVGRRRSGARRQRARPPRRSASVVASGRGAMPAGIVTGQDAADVAAYVASLSE